MAKKTNPVLIEGLLNLGTKLVSTVIDKRAAKKAAGDAAAGNATAAPLSSTRLVNVIGTPVIIGFALNDMATAGINQQNLIVLGCGVVYSVALAFITYFKEKND